MTTKITLAAIEASLRNKITTDGTIMVRLSDECLAQMNHIVDRIRVISKYDESKLDDEQLDHASVVADRFHNSAIGTKFTDGYLDLEEETHVERILADLEERFSTDDIPPGFMVPVFLVNKILNETKSFAV
jgi:hypothetical protein